MDRYNTKFHHSHTYCSGLLGAMTAPSSASHVRDLATTETGKHTDAAARQCAGAVLITCPPDPPQESTRSGCLLHHT